MIASLLHNKILVFIVGAALLGGAFAGIAELGSRAEKHAPIDTTAGKQKMVQINNTKDSDRDGLKDWEEELWETDPQNPDTDGDGTNDGDETKENRDPTKPGPDDALPEPSQQENTSRENGLNNTKTRAITNQILNQYLFLRQNGGASEDDIQNLARQITSTSVFNSQSNIYTRDDINISTDNSKEALHTYTNTIANIFENSPYEESSNEIDIISQAISQSSASKLQELTPVAGAYRSINEEFLSVSVPSALVDIHLAFLNNFERIASSLLEARYFYNDPLRGFGGIGTYQKAALKVNENVLRLKSVLAKERVVFTSKDSGYVFFE